MADSILNLIFRTLKQGSGEKEAQSGLQGVQGAFQELTGVSLTAAGGIAIVGAALAASVNAAAEAEKVQAQLNAVIQSTGGAAGMTADDVNRMSSRLSDLSSVEDETIAKASAVMLTFTKIGKEIFPETMEAALNVSAALGQDLQSSVVQLGKALNDPIQGMSALQRVGVSFTDSQKEQIKALQEAGDLMGAQKIILAELNTEFGGAAEAMGNTYAGQVQKLKNEFGNLAETVGGELLPALTSAAGALNILLSWNRKVEDAVAQHNEAVSASSSTYAEYREEMMRTFVASGQMVDINTDQMASYDGIQAEVDATAVSLGMLTEAQWQEANAAAQAAAIQAQGDAQRTAGMMAYTQASEAAARANQGQTQSLKEIEEVAKQVQKAESDLTAANQNLAKAQGDWAKGAGADVKGQLEQGWISADKYKLALAAIDETYGTGFENQQNYQKDVKALTDEYKKTGDIETFKRKLEELRGEYMKNDERVKESTAKVTEFTSALNSIPTTKEVWVYLHAIMDEVGNPGDGGGDDGDGTGKCCFTGDALIDTPDGRVRLDTLRAGNPVLVFDTSGRIVTAQIERVLPGSRNDLKRVELSDGRKFLCSPDHPWKIHEQGFVDAQDLQVGMAIVNTGETVVVARVSNVRGRHTVYDLVIDHPDHTYLVEGIVVHNKKACPTFMSPTGSTGVRAPGVSSGRSVVIQNVHINNGMDLEEFKFHVSEVLSGRE